jgi:hypothetical protein
LKRKPLSPDLENKYITNGVTYLNMKIPRFCYVTLRRWVKRLEGTWCPHLPGLKSLKFFFEPSTVKALNMKAKRSFKNVWKHEASDPASYPRGYESSTTAFRKPQILACLNVLKTQIFSGE